MQIIENKALLLNLSHPQRVLQVIPKSKQLDDNRVLVRWGYDEARVLKNLHIRNVPSPILRDYDWPGLHRPFTHQKTTASFLTLNQRAFCFNEQGTGKTGSAIWAADYLMRMGLVKRVLVICPLSIMDSAWRVDLFKFAMHRSVDIAYGDQDKRRKIIQSEAEFIIINYDGVEIVADAIANGSFDLIVVDEANAYKNAQTKRWKTLSKLVTPHTWLWMMTGTPAAQSPTDAYGLAKLVNPEGVPKFFTSFKDRVMYKVTQFKWTAKPEAADIVFKALQPAIRFTKDECLDLPDMVYTERDVELTPQQRKYYDMMRKQFIVKAAGEEITAVNAAVNINKLLQISCGAVYSDSGETISFDINNRYNVLTEIIDQTVNKILIFVPFKHIIELLHDKLQSDSYTSEIIDGNVAPHKRADIFRKFQNDTDPRILLIQPQAAAHGVTLTAADTIVWWGPTPSLEIYAQANARAHRAGQQHRVTVIRLQGSRVEKHMYNMLDKRINTHEQLVDLYKNLLDLDKRA